MKRLAFFLLLTTTAWAQERPVHTFSIVARDQQTGETWCGGAVALVRGGYSCAVGGSGRRRRRDTIVR